MVAAAYDELPLEACGLLGGTPDGTVSSFVRCANADRSSRTYAIDGRQLLAAERRFEADGLEVVGVVHSHTHTPPYPSPTDVERAALLGAWRFVIVSLAAPEPETRCYRIEGGAVTEEPITLVGR